jgi:poly(A) polymerase
MRIQGDWLNDPATQNVMAMLADAGHQAYFVGGCVRNALLGVAVADVDIATDALPDRVMTLAAARGLKAVATGIEHGTVTVVSKGVAHQVTTFRKDIQTDGRHAVVSFSRDITDDARRRDFTMNALYASLNGAVSDPLGGLDDLRAGRVRFIDDAQARIKEDYLRSLRFFRFHAWYGDATGGLDADALAAISANLDGLDRLSGERVGSEITRLLAAPDPAPALAAMGHAGVLARILPGANSRALAVLIHAEDGEAADPMRRLAALGGQDLARRLRLSRKQDRSLAVLRDNITSTASVAALAYRIGAQAARDITMLQAALLDRELPRDFRQQADMGAAQVFPVKAADLMEKFEGEALGQLLKELETRWIHSDFELTRSQLLT